MCSGTSAHRTPRSFASSQFWYAFSIISLYRIMLTHCAGISEEDIIDEVLTYFRANVLFRNFEVKGSADRTLIYLTLHAAQCLVKCERIDDKPSGTVANLYV